MIEAGSSSSWIVDGRGGSSQGSRRLWFDPDVDMNPSSGSRRRERESDVSEDSENASPKGSFDVVKSSRDNDLVCLL